MSFLTRLSLAAEFPEGSPDRDPQRRSSRPHRRLGRRRPGRNRYARSSKAPERDWSPTELDRLATLAAAQSFTSEQVLALFGSRCVNVYLTQRRSLWAAVPVNVWNYTLGGYQILKNGSVTANSPSSATRSTETQPATSRRSSAESQSSPQGPSPRRSYAAIFPTATGLTTNH